MLIGNSKRLPYLFVDFSQMSILIACIMTFLFVNVWSDFCKSNQNGLAEWIYDVF